ncbi:MAG: hypothetical protein HXX16_15245 [Bacteroidales bacterium]|nr:hypothetical protein [Bacteroidales bacterium]
MKNVFVTGIGVISPLGISPEDHISALKNFISGIQDTSGNNNYFLDNYGIAADFNPKDFIEDKKALKIMSRQTILGCSAAVIAIKNAGLDKHKIEEELNDNAVIFGAGIWNGSIITMIDALKTSITSNGQIDYALLGNEGYRNLPPLWILPRLPNTTAGQISIQNKIKGLNYTVVNGPNNGIIAIGEAFINIKTGRCKRIISGGAEGTAYADLYSPLKKRGIVTDNVNDSVPFGLRSKGYLCGEGAAVVVIEDDNAVNRQVSIKAEIVGYNNCYIPDFNLQDIERISIIYETCIRETLNSAGVQTEQIGFVQASASGHPVLDRAEASAILQLFGHKVAVTSIHSLTGNLFAASGPTSLACAIFQMNNGFISPMGHDNNLFFKDEINYILNNAKITNTEYVLVNSFDFTGSACCILLKKY